MFLRPSGAIEEKHSRPQKTVYLALCLQPPALASNQHKCFVRLASLGWGVDTKPGEISLRKQFLL